MKTSDMRLTGGAVQCNHSREVPQTGTCPICNPATANGNAWQAKQPSMMRHPGFFRTEFAKKDSVHFSTQPDASGNYPALHGYHETMRIDAGNKTIQITRKDLSLWTFNDDPAKTAPVGAIVSVVAADGNITEYEYNSAKKISQIKTRHHSQPNRILETLEYSWNASGQISSIVKRIWNGSSLQNVERTSYTYHTGADAFGNAGDLRTTIKEIADGTNWVAAGTHYYRYYKHGDPKGRANWLKMAFYPEDFQHFAATHGTTACFNVSDSIALNFSTKYYEYDSSNRIALERVNRNTKTIQFAYTEYPDTTDHNVVHRRTIETGPFGEQNTVFTNFKGKVLLKEMRPPQGSGEETAIHYCIYNADGKRTHRYYPKSVVSYTLTANNPRRLNVTFASNEGLVKITEYYTDSATTSKDNIHRKIIRRGNNGTQIIQAQKTYERRQVGSRIAWNVTTLTQYEDDANARSVVTRYAYTYHANSTQIEQKTTTYPAVPTNQNGTNASATRVDRYNVHGKLIWSRNELGIITYRQYDAVTGMLVKEIQDASTSQTADFTVPVPSGWSTASGAGRHLVTEYEYDNRRRVTQTLGPRNTVLNDSNQSAVVRPASWTVYDDARFTVRSASGFATMSGNNITGYTLVNPVSITIRNAVGRVVDQIRATRAATAGKLLPTNTFAQSTYTAWTRNLYQSGRHSATRQYHLIPTSGEGARNTNYLETTFGYDTRGRQNRTTSPDGTITEVDFDRKNNVIRTRVGTTNTNLILVSETEYGDAGVCSTCTGQRDKPRVSVQHVNANTMRITEYGYDWRGRQIFVFHEQDADGRITYSRQTYDNLNRAIRSEQFLLTVNSGSAQPTGRNRAIVLRNNLNDDTLLARTENFYDTRGRVWKTEQSVINPANGAVQGKLLGQFWYDAAGRIIRQAEPGANEQTEYTYDSLGRVQHSQVKIGNTVFNHSDFTYDNLGNVILSTEIERLSTATSTGNLTLTTGRYQSVASWYDRAGRLIATANYGTNGGTALTRPATVPSRSDNILVTETRYDAATGRAFRTIDPAGRDHRSFFDALGRTTRTVANFTGTGNVSASTPDQNVTVETTYHPSGQIATLTAKNPTTGDQITRYIYGTAKAWQTPLLHRNDWLAAEIYPDSDDSENASGILQNGPDGMMDRVEFQYNRQGEVIAKRDQNGTIHTYEYDDLGRLLHDRITTLATGIDGTVRRISTTYDTVGNVRSVTSFNNAATNTGTVLNQVVYEYDANGLLSRESSNPGGAVVASTPHIGYTYDTTKSGELFTKRLRPLTMKYPSGKTLTYFYGTTGSNDDLLGRSVEIREGATPLVQYAYNGISTPVKVIYPQPNLALDYTTSTALDRFGRIIDHAWRSSATDIVRIQHGYDRVGNRKHRREALQTTHSPVPLSNGEVFCHLHKDDSLDCHDKVQ